MLAVLGCAICFLPLVGCWELAADRAGREAARGARCTLSVGVSGIFWVTFISHISEAELHRITSGWLWSQMAALTCS